MKITFMAEDYIKPSTKMLQFFVKDEPGALAEALKAFQVTNFKQSIIPLLKCSYSSLHIFYIQPL